MQSLEEDKQVKALSLNLNLCLWGLRFQGTVTQACGVKSQYQQGDTLSYWGQGNPVLTLIGVVCFSDMDATMLENRGQMVLNSGWTPRSVKPLLKKKPMIVYNVY